jgi:Protein of unknown function (DUF3500)
VPARGYFLGVPANMGPQVVAFLDGLDAEQQRRATAAFDTPDHRHWTYLPGDRPGLRLADMTTDQREEVLSLLDHACSAAGAMTTRAVIDLDLIRRRLDGEPDADDDEYWVRVLGDPRGGDPWAWRLNGHHLAIHLTVVGDDVAATPQFFGAEPAVVPAGPHRGLRILPAEEELARTLMARLDESQRAAAIFAEVAPDDILTRRDPIADPAVIPAGVPWSQLTGPQHAALERLIRVYFDRASTEVADGAWAAAVDAGLDAIEFSWAGPVEPGEGHYYAVRGPTFLVEYDNTQDDANHIHSVWRDLRRDWGSDLLGEHYAEAHR